MDPDTGALRQRLDRASRVLAFAEAAGDESAIRIAGAVLVGLLAQAEEHGIESGSVASRDARPGPGATNRRSA